MFFTGHGVVAYIINRRRCINWSALAAGASFKRG